MNPEIKFITSEESDKHYFKIHQDVFISFHLIGSDSIAYILKSSDCNEKQVDIVIKAAIGLLSKSSKDFHCKVVGKKKNIDLVSASLESNQIVNYKNVVREDEFEIIFLPKSGDVKLAKEASPKVIESKIGPVEKEVARKIKVMVIDDSKTIRVLLSKIFNSSPLIEVVAAVENPLEAEELIKKHRPDVITLDIHMPGMNGVELIKRYYPIYPIPTIMITSVNIKEGPLVFEALEIGAFDYIQKPKMEEIKEVSGTLIEKVISAAESKKKKKKEPEEISIPRRDVGNFGENTLIVLGASTGGTNAIKAVLEKFPSKVPPILIVQHIPPVFSRAFAERLNGLLPFKVTEAKNGDVIENNHVYIAEGGRQMRIKEVGDILKIELTDDPPVNRFKPSVDYLFDSAKSLVSKKNLVGVLLTGMGKDGANGLLKLKQAGARTIAQDEESSVVFGMPREAIRLGGAEVVSHLDDVASDVARLSKKR